MQQSNSWTQNLGGTYQMEEQNNVVEQVEQPQEEAQTEQPKQEKLYTKAEIDEMFSKRIGKEKAKLEKQFEERFNERLNALEEAQKLSKLSEQEKAEYQAQKEREAFEAERQLFYEERDAFNRDRYKATIEQELQSKGLPTSLSDMLCTMDAEAVNQKITELSESFGASISNQINERLKQTTTPQEPTVEKPQLLTIEQIQKLTPQEYMKNKELVEQSLKDIYKK